MVAKGTHIERRSELNFLVNTTVAGLKLIETHPNIYTREIALAAAVIVDSNWDRTLYILAENFGTKIIHVPKRMLV